MVQQAIESASPKWSKARMLEAVEASPAAVAIQDKQKWLALFAPDAVVQDPVGTQPCINTRSPQADQDNDVGKFYETFIAPSSIEFAVKDNYFCGDTVVRDLSVHTTLSSGIQIEVPMHLFYQLQEHNGALKFVALAAHWELRQMIPQVLGQGLKGLQTMLALSARMLKHQGIMATIRYSDGMLKGIFAQGKQDVKTFVEICNGANLSLELRLEDGFAGVEIPYGSKPIGLKQAAKALGNVQIQKCISAGYCTTFSFTATQEELDIHGIGKFTYSDDSKKIQSIQLFTSI